jgi:hypothetical protein
VYGGAVATVRKKGNVSRSGNDTPVIQAVPNSAPDLKKITKYASQNPIPYFSFYKYITLVARH